MFGKEPHFLLNDDGEIDYKNLNKFIDRHHKEKIFIFGFTSFVYENLIKKLDKSKFNRDLSRTPSYGSYNFNRFNSLAN